ncbi:MAG: hypothetical protein ACOX3K_05690 [Bacilli bacterium]|jgi:hypothetical protein
MKIVIKSKEDKKRLRIIMPLALIKSRLFTKLIVSKKDSKMTQEEIQELREMFKQAYQVLKQFKKAHGRFKLIEVQSHDGDEVLIRI